MGKQLILSEKELKNLINDYKNGKSLRDLAKKYNHSRASLSKILKKNNIMIRDNSLMSRKYFHNEDFFEKIDNEHKAYWLGFIYADGYIETKRLNSNQKFGITLSIKDFDHLKKFKDDINATNPIKIYNGSGFNKTGQFAKILLTSQKTVDDLKIHGVIEQKTLLLTMPNIPEELIPHFIRGYFDGDGSLSYYMTKKHRNYRIGFVGTKKMMQSFNKFFNKNLALCQKGQIFQLNIGGNYQVKQIMDCLYKDATIYLDRKYDKYLNLCKYSES